MILGSIRPSRQHHADLGGLRTVDIYVPVAVLLGMIVGALQSMPQNITGYRERGILRRMSTAGTPVRPAVRADAGLRRGGARLGPVRAGGGPTRLRRTTARPPYGSVLALLLAILAALALGAVVSALSRTTKYAGAIRVSGVSR